MPKAKEKIKSAERHDRGKSWTSEEEDLLVDFWSREKIKGDTYSTYRIPPFKTNNRECYVLFFNAPNQFPSDRGMKIELYTFGLRPCVGMHGTGAAYVTLLVSFSRQARAGVCIHICRGGLWVIDGSASSALRAGAVCKRGGKEPTSQVWLARRVWPASWG